MNRKDWLSILAKADNKQIKALWQQTNFAKEVKQFTWLREPEIGLLPLQGRTGNTGDKFLFGDATITRAVVQINAHTGYSFVIGRDKACAEICAKIDALMQDSAVKDKIHQTILAPLAERTTQRHQQEQAEVAQTKVDFFTMVRGE